MTVTINPEEFLKLETDQEFLERLVVTPESFESYSMRHEYDMEIIDMHRPDKGVVLRMQQKAPYLNPERTMTLEDLKYLKGQDAVALVCAQRQEHPPEITVYYGLPVRKTIGSE